MFGFLCGIKFFALNIFVKNTYNQVYVWCCKYAKTWWRHQIEAFSVLLTICAGNSHDDVIKWKHFPHNWPFVRGIHLSPVNSPHKGHWHGALMFSLICVLNKQSKHRWFSRHRAHYDVIVMSILPHMFCSKWLLTHWGRVMRICVSKLASVGSGNGLSPGRRQAIIWTNAVIWLIGPLGTSFSEILIEIYTFSFKKIHLKVSSGKWRPSCLGLSVL